jgi:uncharacterized protein with HEPN domain
MSRDSYLYLEDILQACRKIQRYISGIDYEHFIKDDRTYDAVCRNLEIIGEAARKIPPEIQQEYSIVEWRSITSFRNLLAHEYFSIKDEILWDIVQNKIPSLQEHIQAVLEKMSK